MKSKFVLVILSWTLPAICGAAQSPYEVLKAAFNAGRPAKVTDLPPLSLATVEQWACYSVRNQTSPLDGPLDGAPTLVSNVPVVVDAGTPTQPAAGPLFQPVPGTPSRTELQSALIFARRLDTDNPNDPKREEKWLQKHRQIAADFLQAFRNRHWLTYEPELTESEIVYGSRQTTTYRIYQNMIIRHGESEDGLAERMGRINAYGYCFKK